MKRQRLLLGLILAGYLIITLAYGAINPLFEAPDENWHFFTTAYIARNGRLPVVEDPPDPFWGRKRPSRRSTICSERRSSRP